MVNVSPGSGLPLESRVKSSISNQARTFRPNFVVNEKIPTAQAHVDL